MSNEENRTSIRRIRLVNFHNFVDETIDIRQGGHLFLLGDNASGKTTLLDAVHYALTAGEFMEFNSAARVAGNREGGRRIQGVIMRYNVDSGPLNPDGAISYVALEIQGPRERPTTVAVGMTVRGMEDKVQRWGVVRECPLADIPFTIEEAAGPRPATRQEMRDWFGERSGFYGTIGAYEREVASRFLGGEEPFADVCKLLSMGKAYREIVSHTADYHQLFRGLLPEPHVEMFEQVISALRSLDQATADLQALEEKCVYLDQLSGLVEHIDDLRNERLCLQWLRYGRLAQDHHVRIEEYRRLETQRRASIQQIKEAGRTCRRQQDEQQKQLDDLRLRDTSGVIAQEKDLAEELERLVSVRADHTAAVQAAATNVEKARGQRDGQRHALRRVLASFSAHVSDQAGDLPFSVNDVLHILDDAHAGDQPEDLLDDIPFDALRDRALEASRKPGAELAVLQHRREEAESRAAEVRRRIASLESVQEVLPAQEGFGAALECLRREMIDVLPIYMGLAWDPALAAATRAAIEETIGEDVLSVLMVRDQDVGKARELVLAEFPGVRVARWAAYGDLPDWFRGVFDRSRSEAAALRCLAEEMLAHDDPELFDLDGGKAVRFRSHERRLSGALPRLIGSESRREAQLREKATLEKELSALEDTIVALEQAGGEASALASRLDALRTAAEEALAAVTRLGREIHRHDAALNAHEREHQGLKRRLEEINEEVRYREVRLAELQQAIEREGLDQLEQRIERGRRKLAALRDQERELHTQQGALENQLKGITQSIESLTAQAEAAEQHQQAEAVTIAALVPQVDEDTVADHVNQRFAERRFDALSAVDEALNDLSRQQGICEGELHTALQHPTFGALFGFSYNEQANELVDRRDVGVAELAASERQFIEEQRQVINRQTQELFRRLIVEQLLGYLSRYVRDLRHMVKRINSLLGEREFGSCSYRLQVAEVERYKRLIDIVEHYNPFEAEKAAQQIRLFFEDHKEDILDTEVNAVPDVLDYRNWFHYDMRVRSTGGDGVVMDRRNKSIGSGGEQAVPNYLLILTIADFLYRGSGVKLHALIFDEAFYGIDSGRRDQILGFATDLGLQLFVASPDQDGVKREVAYSTTILVVKDEDYDVHLFPYHWENPEAQKQPELLAEYQNSDTPVAFGDEL